MGKHNPYKNIADRDSSKVEEENVRVSFEYLDWAQEEFFFHGLEKKYYQKFFDTLTTLKASKEREITQQTHSSLCPRSIFNTSTSIKDSFPIYKLKNKLKVQTRDDVQAEEQANEIASRAFEISLSKNYGRIHGFMWNNIFHIVWIDPAHNLFPMKRGVKKHSDAATVRCFSPDECLRLQEKIKVLQEEIGELYEVLENS